MIFESESNGGACEVDEEQLTRVTTNHVLAFFESQDNFRNLTLVPRVFLTDDLSFACQDGTEIALEASLTYSVISRGTPAQIRRALLRYLHQTRNSLASFLRELGWQDLKKVDVKSFDEDEEGVTFEIPKATEEDSWLDENLLLIITIGVPCFVLTVVVIIFMICRKRGCCGGGNLERERPDRGEQSTPDPIPLSPKLEGQNDVTRASSSVGTLSGTSDEENSVPLSQEQKSRGTNNLIASTVTVATHDMSSVSLSRVLGSQASEQSFRSSSSKSPSFEASFEASENTSADHRSCPGVDRGRLFVKSSDQIQRRQEVISPQSDCRGLLKTPTIYRYLEAKLSTTSKHAPTETEKKAEYLRKLAELKAAASVPEKKAPSRPKRSKSISSVNTSILSAASAMAALSLGSTKGDDDDSNVNQIKSAIGRFVNSTKESKGTEMETRSYASSFVPNFMMSFGSTLSVATNGGSSVSSKSASGSEQQEFDISGVDQVESQPDPNEALETQSKEPSVTNSQETVKSRGGASLRSSPSVHRRYSFAQKEQLLKEDLDPIVVSPGKKNQSLGDLPRTNSFHSPHRCLSNSSLDEKPDTVDPVFSSLLIDSSADDDGNSSANTESVDEDASDYSPPERTYFFTE